MEEKMRNMGIGVIDSIPWGTHFCQFYRTKEDLIDILVPYFKAGLENNEFCMWVTSEPLSEREAERAMRKAVPNFAAYSRRSQIEFIPHSEWYLEDGAFSLQRVLNACIDKVNQAVSGGFDGIRVTGNTAWLEQRDWESFVEYEEKVNRTIGKYRMITICTYHLDRCRASEVIDVVSNHQFSLIRWDGKWKVIEDSEHRYAKDRISKQHEFLRDALESLTHPFYVVDVNDYTIKMANSAAGKERITPGIITCYALTHRSSKPCGTREHPCPLEVVKKKKKPVVAEHIHYDKDGNLRNFEVHGYPILDSKGNVIQMIEYALDITERKKAEQKLERNQEMLKASERSLKEFSRNVLSVREEEKRKLAANLHDAVGSLAVDLSSRLGITEREVKDGNLQGALESLQQIKRTVKQEVRALKRIAREVRPPDLDIIGLPGALRTYFSNITKETRIKIDFSTSVDRETISDDAAIVLYRTAQEALSNVINHANAEKVKVRLYSQYRTVKLNICDDGKGFDVEKALGGTKVKGIGLRGMQERAKSLDGRFTIKSTPKKGTEIMVTLPMTSKQK